MLREFLKCHIKFNFQVGQREVGVCVSHWLDLDAPHCSSFISLGKIIISNDLHGHSCKKTVNLQHNVH